MRLGTAARAETRSNPESDDGRQGDGGQEVRGELVVAGCDASKVLEAAEGRFDPSALAVASFAVDDRCLPAWSAWDHGPLADVAKPLPQSISIIAPVSGEPAHRSRSIQQVICSTHVADIAGCQPEDRRAAEAVGDGMDLCCLPASGRADCLRLRPCLVPAFGGLDRA